MKIIKTPSVNFEKRTEKPSFIIFHAISTSPLKSLEILTQKSSGVSAHYYIERNGTIHELVHPDQKAFHAGISAWKDKTSLNNCSIGIEFQTYQTPQHLFAGFTHKQIKSGILLCQHLMQTYNIQPYNIVGHSDIAPHRKEDPGCLFPWKIFEKNGIGITPKEESPILDVSERLKKIGYPIDFGTDACIIAFKRHFMPYAQINATTNSAFLKKLSYF